MSGALIPELRVGNVIVVGLDNDGRARANRQQIAYVLSRVMSGRAFPGEGESKLALLREAVEAAAFKFELGRAGFVADNDKVYALFEASLGELSQHRIRRRD